MNAVASGSPTGPVEPWEQQATGEIDTIVRSLGAVLPLHGFGVKTDRLAR